MPGARGWPANATVTIYGIGVSQSFLNQIQTAFQNWNTALSSGLTITAPKSVSSVPSNPPTPYVVVQYGSVTAAGCPAGSSACTSPKWLSSGPNAGYTQSVTMTLDSSLQQDSNILPLAAHEVGHAYGEMECDQCGNSLTIMYGSNINLNSPISPKIPCDQNVVNAIKSGAYGTGGSGGGTGGSGGGYDPCSGGPTVSCPGFTPVCTPSAGWYCSNECIGSEPAPCCEECYEACEDGEWTCVGSPIVLDVAGTGFHLTDISGGVKFRVLPGQDLHQMGWPISEFKNGWLALDRNGDGKIDDFTELFGNATPQSPSAHPNGYLALAVFDDPQNGGNGNGFIDPEDAVYSHLRVWIDDNHNGVSEPAELHTLQEVGVFRIDLHYSETPFVDENGNIYRYKSRIWDRAGEEHDVCYDVFVKIAN